MGTEADTATSLLPMPTSSTQSDALLATKVTCFRKSSSNRTMGPTQTPNRKVDTFARRKFIMRQQDGAAGVAYRLRTS